MVACRGTRPQFELDLELLCGYLAKELLPCAGDRETGRGCPVLDLQLCVPDGFPVQQRLHFDHAGAMSALAGYRDESQREQLAIGDAAVRDKAVDGRRRR